MVDIKGFEGLYAITSCGKVWSYRSKKFLSPSKTPNGYYHVLLQCKEKKICRNIHRLVAEAYLDNPYGKDTVDHIDGNPENNNVNNLQWLTHTENKVKGKRGKVCKIVCVDDGRIFDTQKECANFYGLDSGNVNKVIMGKLKTTGGKIFKRKDV